MPLGGSWHGPPEYTLPRALVLHSSPAVQMVAGSGQTHQVDVTGLALNGDPASLVGYDLRFDSDNPAIASVDPLTGLVTVGSVVGVTGINYYITVGIYASITVTVVSSAPTVNGMTIVPDPVNLFASGSPVTVSCTPTVAGVATGGQTLTVTNNQPTLCTVSAVDYSASPILRVTVTPTSLDNAGVTIANAITFSVP